MTTATMEKNAAKVVSHDEWLAARKKFLAKEKEFSRQRDEAAMMVRSGLPGGYASALLELD